MSCPGEQASKETVPESPFYVSWYHLASEHFVAQVKVVYRYSGHHLEAAHRRPLKSSRSYRENRGRSFGVHLTPRKEQGQKCPISRNQGWLREPGQIRSPITGLKHYKVCFCQIKSPKQNGMMQLHRRKHLRKFDHVGCMWEPKAIPLLSWKN